MTDWRKQLDAWDQGIKLGQGRSVAAALKCLNYSKIPRQHIASVAKTAYRANLPFVSLRVINQLIKPGKNRWQSATPSEIAEYSMSLIRIGAATEALSTLDSLSAAKLPVVSLYRSFALITQWEYGKAIPFLEEFIGHSDVENYQRLVAQVNLAAAWINTESFTRAEKLLTKLVKKAQDGGHVLLAGNCLELLSQIAIFNKNWKMANEYLLKSEKHLLASRSVDFLFLKKWRVLLKLYRGQNIKSTLDELKSIRAEASRLKHWETTRDCDFYTAKFSADDNLMRFVHFGTPFNGYREFMSRRLNHSISMPATFVYRGKRKPKIIYDLKSASDEDSRVTLKEGSLPHRFLAHLCSDFYRPFRYGAIFAELYPSEYFDPELSVTKINQLAQRLRRWLEENKLEVEFKSRDGAFRLHPTGNVGFRLHEEHTVHSGLAVYLERMKASFGKREFSAGTAADVLGVTRRMINKIISWDEGRSIFKTGDGPSVRYRFTT